MDTQKDKLRELMENFSIHDILKNYIEEENSILLLLELVIEEKKYESIVEVLNFLPHTDEYMQIKVKTLEDNILYLSDEDKTAIIVRLPNDNIKINLLEKYKDTFKDKTYLCQIIVSLNDDNLSMKYFRELKDNFNSELYIEYLRNIKSDDLRLKEYNEFHQRYDNEDIDWVYELIYSFSSAEIKNEFLDNNMQYLKIKNMKSVFLSIKDENKIAKIIEKNIDFIPAHDLDDCIYWNIKTQEVCINLLTNISHKISSVIIAELVIKIIDQNAKLSILDIIISKNRERVMEIYNAIANKDVAFFEENIYSKINLWDEEDKKIVENLLNKDSWLFQTFNFKLLDIKEIKNAKYFEILATQQGLASHVINMYQNNKKKFQILTKLLEYLVNQDLVNILIVSAVIQEINQNAYDTLIQDINLENFNENNLKTLMFIILKNNTFYNGGNSLLGQNKFRQLTKGRTPIPSTYADLENYFIIYNKPFDDEFATSNNIKQLKRLIFNKHFGIENFIAEDLLRQYSVSLDKIEDPELVFIKKIKYVSELESEEELKKYYLEETPSPLEYTFIDSKIKKIFNNSISDSLFKVNDASLMKTVEYGGKEVKVYAPQDDFYLMVHSLVMWQFNPKPISNYNTYWNNKGKPGFCCSLISNQQPISLAIVQDVILGFDGFSSDSIQLMSSNDLISESGGEEFSSKEPSKFMLSEDLIDYTRERHNELVVKRRELRNIESPYHNMQPNYVIIYDTTPNNLVERSLKAATELNIPILFIDTKLISKRENEIITNLFNEFMTTLNVNTFEKMLKRFCNNANTYRQNTEIQKQYFSTEILSKYLDQIYNQVISNCEKNSSEVETIINILKQIIQILKEEKNKELAIYDSDRYMLILLNSYIEKFNYCLELIKSNNYNAENSFRQ